MGRLVSLVCALAAIACVGIGFYQVYIGQSIFPVPYTFTPRALLIAAGVVLLFGINWNSCCKK